VKAPAPATNAAPTRASAPARVAQAAPPARDSDTASVPGRAPGLARLRASLSGGAALPPDTRRRMEAGFGGSLADVRVHTGAAAATAAGGIGAEAFASGRDIAFAPGAYRPGTRAGDRLIAHEVAHVVQQRSAGSGGEVQAKSLVSSPGDAAEIAADRAAEVVLAGGRAPRPAGGLTLRGRIMRRARLGIAAVSPALSLAPARPGAAAPGAGPALTPVMTSTISPAGGKLTGIDRTAGPGRTEPSAKTPDEAQTARGETPGEAKSPVSVMVAGAPAGAEDAAGKEPKPEEKKDAAGKKGEKKKDAAEKESKAAEGGPAAAARGGPGAAMGRTRKFGRNLGDRGAAAAAAAKARLGARATAMETTEGATTRIGAARKAVEPPPTAAEVDGKRQQAGTLAEAELPPPDAAAAGARARATLESAAPTTIEELDTFAGPGGAGTRNALSASVAAEADQQAGPVIRTMSSASNPPLGAEPPPAVPQPDPIPALASPEPALAAATPPPAPEESLDATEFREDAEGALAEHEVDDATLAKADEGPLREIGNDKEDLNEKVATAAEHARGQEAAALGAAEGALANEDAAAVGGMEIGRTAGQKGVSAEQEGTRTGEQTAEQTLAERITGIYTAAEGAVTEKLGALQGDAVARFQEQQGARLEAFSSGVRADLDAFKDRRYSGLRGLYYKGRDWVLGINDIPEVKALYERHRNQYIADIDGLLGTIKAEIETTITECKQTLADARTEIDTLVETSGAKMDSDAAAALERARQGFSQMEARIESTRQGALQALDRERERAIAAMDKALAEIKSENKGLLDKIANAIRALAQLLGQFMALIVRITRMGVGGFLSAALSQAREGVENHLWSELQNVFREWVFMKLPMLQLMLALPPNWLEMLAALGASMIGLFSESLPEMMPAIGIAAMSWLAVSLAAKLIPGVGAIMAVIDGIRAAWSLVQSLFSAAAAFFQFVMQVAAPGNGALAFARALAHGIMAALDAILTFLGVDRLIRRVIGAIARPFGRVVSRVQARFRASTARRRQRGETRPSARRRDDEDGRDGDAQRRSAESRARRDDQEQDRRQIARRRDEQTRPERRRETPAERRRREREEQERRDRERLDRAVQAIGPQVDSLLAGGVSRLRLSAQAAIWRVRYRIRSVTFIKSGRNAKVEAANSPPVSVRTWFAENADGIHRMVLDIGTERYGRASATLRRSSGGRQPGLVTRREDLSHSPGQPMERIGAAVRERGGRQIIRRPPGETTSGGDRLLDTRRFNYLTIGNQRVPFTQGSGSAANPDAIRNIIIRGGGDYPGLMGQMGFGPNQGREFSARILAGFASGRPDRNTAMAGGLFFGAEVARAQQAAATSPLALLALSRGAPPERLFGRGGGAPLPGEIFQGRNLNPFITRRQNEDIHAGGGIYPPSAHEYAESARVQRGDSSRPSATSQRGVRAEIDVLRHVELVYQVVGGMEFRSISDLRAEIRRQFDIVDRLGGVRP
jgi:hypothetical protein